MRVGLILPSFQPSPQRAVSVATTADENGIDGVFAYDHFFPIGHRDLPALAPAPLLGAVAVRTERIRVGTLVSRVTMVPLPVLVDSMVTVDEVSGHRAIAGLGVGDALTIPENEAYGLPFPGVDQRLELMRAAARDLREAGVETWIGGRSRPVQAIAAADADAWNLWDGTVDALAAFARDHPGGPAITWGGPPPVDGDFARHLQALAKAGVSWAVYGPPSSVDWDAFIAKLAGAARVVR